MHHSNVEPNSGGREARVAHLDLIRGMALLGIIIANMPLYASPSIYMNMLNNQWWTTWPDLFVKQFIYIAVDYKFISIFSFLFGVGFILFLQNAEKKGSGFKLLTYAILGLVLLAFYRRRLNTLPYTAIGLLLIPAIWVAAESRRLI